MLFKKHTQRPASQVLSVFIGLVDKHHLSIGQGYRWQCDKRTGDNETSTKPLLHTSESSEVF